MSDGWRHCSTCKKTIDFGAKYYECSVSTCNRKRLAMYFCTVECWTAHLPMMRHRDAWANEKHAPTREAWEAEQRSENRGSSPRREKPLPAAERGRVAPPPPMPTPRADAPQRTPLATNEDAPREILIVVSRLKAYVKARADMNTSDNVFPVLSDIVRDAIDAAIREADRDGRRTVMNRDFKLR